jgi:hypothetical protein
MPSIPQVFPKKPKKDLPKLKVDWKPEKKLLPKLKPDKFPRGNV